MTGTQPRRGAFGRARLREPRRRGPRRRERGRLVGAILVACVSGVGLVACSNEPSNALNWYINPDNGGQEEIAARCTEAAGGEYTITTSLLPREASAQREQLIRRLSANDSSIDLMSLDPPFIPEFAEAGFLAEIPQEVQDTVTEDVLESALIGSTWKDELVTAPFWANTQLLWYRQSVAEAAGLDMEEPVTWQQLIDASVEQEKTLAVQGIRAEALTVWINALITSAGGQIIENPEADPGEVELGLVSEAGRTAAAIINEVASSGVGGPALSNQNEDASRAIFEGDDAGFMVNYPFVWTAALDAVEGGTLDQSVLDDYGWARYPAVEGGGESRPPYGGINIGVGAFSDAGDLAFDAVQCIVSEENQAYYFETNGNPPSKAGAYDYPEVQDAFPMADTIRESLENAAPRPQTAYYNEISAGLQRTWHPPSSVDPDQTPEASTELITAVLNKEDLL